jgi:uncharacterized protein YkwD
MTFKKSKLIFCFLFMLFLQLSCGNNVAPVKVAACDGSSAENCDCFTATNKERQNAGLPLLNYCPVCFQMAQDQAADVAQYGYFSHDRPAEGSRPAETFAERANRYGLGMGCGENLASGATGTGAVAMWMASPGHKANIMAPFFKSFACGSKNGISSQVFSVNPE